MCTRKQPKGVVVYYREGGLGNFDWRSEKKLQPPFCSINPCHESVVRILKGKYEGPYDSIVYIIGPSNTEYPRGPLRRRPIFKPDGRRLPFNDR